MMLLQILTVFTNILCTWFCTFVLRQGQSAYDEQDIQNDFTGADHVGISVLRQRAKQVVYH